MKKISFIESRLVWKGKGPERVARWEQMSVPDRAGELKKQLDVAKAQIAELRQELCKRAGVDPSKSLLLEEAPLKALNDAIDKVQDGEKLNLIAREIDRLMAFIEVERDFIENGTRIEYQPGGYSDEMEKFNDRVGASLESVIGMELPLLYMGSTDGTKFSKTKVMARDAGWHKDQRQAFVTLLEYLDNDSADLRIGKDIEANIEKNKELIKDYISLVGDGELDMKAVSAFIKAHSKDIFKTNGFFDISLKVLRARNAKRKYQKDEEAILDFSSDILVLQKGAAIGAAGQLDRASHLTVDGSREAVCRVLDVDPETFPAESQEDRKARLEQEQNAAIDEAVKKGIEAKAASDRIAAAEKSAAEAQASAARLRDAAEKMINPYDNTEAEKARAAEEAAKATEAEKAASEAEAKAEAAKAAEAARVEAAEAEKARAAEEAAKATEAERQVAEKAAAEKAAAEKARMEAERQTAAEAEKAKQAEEAAKATEAEKAKQAEEAAKATEAEKARAAEEAAKLEAERQAAAEKVKQAEETAKLEAERQAAAEAKAAAEKAAAEAEKAKQADEEAKVAADRLEAEEAAKLEAEQKVAAEAKVAAEKAAEAEQKAAEVEKARQDAARVEAEKARVAAEKAAAEKAAEAVSDLEKRADAKDAYVESRDALVTAYNNAWKKVEKFGPDGSEAMFKLMKKIDEDIGVKAEGTYGYKFFELKVGTGNDRALEPKIEFLEANKMNVDISTFHIIKGKEVLDQATTAFNKGVEEIVKSLTENPAVQVMERLNLHISGSAAKPRFDRLATKLKLTGEFIPGTVSDNNKKYPVYEFKSGDKVLYRFRVQGTQDDTTFQLEDAEGNVLKTDHDKDKILAYLSDLLASPDDKAKEAFDEKFEKFKLKYPDLVSEYSGGRLFVKKGGEMIAWIEYRSEKTYKSFVNQPGGTKMAFRNVDGFFQALGNVLDQQAE